MNNMAGLSSYDKVESMQAYEICLLYTSPSPRDS